MILALDPGTSKLGWALLDESGRVAGQGIVYLDREANRLAELVGGQTIATVVLGNGTNRVNIEQVVRRLLPQAAVVVVDEKGSTVEAWRMKRQVEAGGNPLRQVWFTLVQLFNPAAVDDYAARVLALRYLRRGNGTP